MMNIRAVVKEDLAALKVFTDQWIGTDYFSLEDLDKIFVQSCDDHCVASFLAEADGEIAAVRLTLLPGTWICGFERGLSPSKWQVEASRVAYFKSLFVADAYRGQGLGPKLTEKSLAVLKERGAQAVLCHSWLESPENSSQRYLESFGFELVCEWPKFWYPIDYQCTRCAPERCLCTAGEMILRL